MTANAAPQPDAPLPDLATLATMSLDELEATWLRICAAPQSDDVFFQYLHVWELCVVIRRGERDTAEAREKLAKLLPAPAPNDGPLRQDEPNGMWRYDGTGTAEATEDGEDER